MVVSSDPIPTAVAALVMLCWLGFCGAFLLRKKPPRVEEQKRERSSVAGIVLQMLGYVAVWSFRRPGLSAIVDMNMVLELLLAALTVGIAIGSVWLVMSAIATLGRQWSAVARIVDRHVLVTGGPYRLVRHPIYTGMFGMMLATGLAISHWIVLGPAVLFFWWGARLRIAGEEKLLHETFGEEYEQYARRVPALIPRLKFG